MIEKINAIFGTLEPKIVHLSTDEEIQMINNLFYDVVDLKEESRSSSLLAWAMFFLGITFSSILTLITLSSASPLFYAVCVLVFSMACMGGYFLWNWKVNKQKEESALKKKKEQFDELMAKIKRRVSVKTKQFNEYEDAISIERLELKEL